MISGSEALPGKTKQRTGIPSFLTAISTTTWGRSGRCPWSCRSGGSRRLGSGKQKLLVAITGRKFWATAHFAARERADRGDEVGRKSGLSAGAYATATAHSDRAAEEVARDSFGRVSSVHADIGSRSLLLGKRQRSMPTAAVGA